MWATSENKVPVNLNLVSSIVKEQDRAMGGITTSIRFEVPGGNPVVWSFEDRTERDTAYDATMRLVLDAQEKPKRGRPPKTETELLEEAPVSKVASKVKKKTSKD